MKKIITILFVTSTLITFAQKNNTDIAAVPVKKTDVLVLKKIEPVLPLPVLDLKTSIQKSFLTGETKIMAIYFGANVDVSLLDKESLYSKPQAEQVLKTFFLEHKATSFTINHDGKSASLKYFIGTYVSGKTSFRVTVNVKIVNKKEYITALIIELND